MKHMRIQKNSGFTLVELLLYVSLFAIILVAVAELMALLLQTRVQNQTISEVEQGGAQALALITQTIRNADSISAPNAGSNAPTLSLSVFNPVKSPTIFDEQDGVLRIKEGLAVPIALISGRLIVSNLRFENLSQSASLGTIRVSFTLTYKNPDGRGEYAYTKQFYASASIR